MQTAQIEVAGKHVVDEVVDGCRDEEVLLLQAQALAGRCRVLGVQDLRDGLRLGLRADGGLVIPGVELREVEVLRGLGAPQPQGVDGIGTVSGNHVVVRDREHCGLGDPLCTVRAVLGRGHGAAEAHLDRHLRVRELPGVAVTQPGVGHLDLPALLVEGLLEDAVFVTDAVSHRRDRHGGQRVEEAGREPAEATVSEAWLHLELPQLVEVEVEGRQCVPGGRLQIRGQQCVVQLTPEQILRREVDDRFGAASDLRLEGLDPARDQRLPDGPCQGHVQVAVRGAHEVDALPEAQFFGEFAGELLRVVEIGPRALAACHW